MDYGQAEEYLNNFVNYEQIPGIPYVSAESSLKHVVKFLHGLGDHHLAARTVHIAGSKGKGSTAAMIARVLTVSGYRTGLYTSPHLHSLTERIRVDDISISQEEFAALVAEMKPYFEEANAAAGQSPESRVPGHSEGAKRAKNLSPAKRGEAETQQPLTYFEALTALAFVYFWKKRADFQVLEVGLGGRLDATNVARPEVCVITPISLEHTQVLGDTLEKIACEKAGIIKPGSVVVNAPQVKEVLPVIESACREREATLIQVGRDITWHSVKRSLDHQSFTVEGKMGTHQLTLPLLGDYQLENAAAAVAALEILAYLGFDISAESIARGLSQVSWPGRFQIVAREPIVLLDGAHNVASTKRLVESIKAYFHYDRLFLIMGSSCDKDISGVVRELASLAPQVIATRSSHSRSAEPDEIAAQFEGQGVQAQVVPTIPEALSLALSRAGKRDIVCVCGSLFVVAEALAYFSRD